MTNKTISDKLRALDRKDQEVIRSFLTPNQQLLQQFTKRTELKSEMKAPPEKGERPHRIRQGL